LIDDALLLGRLEDFPEAKNDACNSQENERGEDYQAPEQQPGRRPQAVVSALQIIGAARLRIV